MIESIEKKTKKEEEEKKEVQKKEEGTVTRIGRPASPSTLPTTSPACTPGRQTMRKSGRQDLAPGTEMKTDGRNSKMRTSLCNSKSVVKKDREKKTGRGIGRRQGLKN